MAIGSNPLSSTRKSAPRDTFSSSSSRLRSSRTRVKTSQSVGILCPISSLALAQRWWLSQKGRLWPLGFFKCWRLKVRRRTFQVRLDPSR
jgi:hypothetical protein